MKNKPNKKAKIETNQMHIAISILQKKEEWKLAFFSSLFCYGIAHGYRFMHCLFSGDALVDVWQNDVAWEISLGRCFMPIWMFLRGTILTPWLFFSISVIMITLTVFFLADFFEIKSRSAIFLTAAVLSSNLVLTSLNAGFLPWADIYLIVVFLNVISAWLLWKKESIFSFLAGILLFTLGLGTYQAYVTVAAAMVMLKFLLELSLGTKCKKVLYRLLRTGIGILISGVVYYISWKTLQKVFGIWTTDGYNGLADLWNYQNVSFIRLLGKTYYNFFDFFWNPNVFIGLHYQGKSLGILWVWLIRGVNIVLLMGLIGYLFYSNRKTKTGIAERILQIGDFLLLPLGINAICILSKGMEHILMVYSFLIPYVFAIKLAFDPLVPERKKQIVRIFAVLSLGTLCWINAVYSNQIYIRKELQEKASLSLLTRIVHDIEGMDGYEPGVTQVALSGSFINSPEIQEPSVFDELTTYGVGDTPLFYYGTEEPFLRYYMHSGILITTVDPFSDAVKEMPCYPKKGSITYIDDVLVVKIADWK